MRARIRNKYDDKYSVTVQLPQTPLELYDILDRLGVDNKYCNVYINIDDERIPEEMCEGGFYDDLFKLNLLAQRLEQMSPAYTLIRKASAGLLRSSSEVHLLADITARSLIMSRLT